MFKLKMGMLLLAAAVYGVVAVSDIGVDQSKVDIVIKETTLTADALKNITISTPQCRLQLASMASDYIVSLNMAVTALNNAVPSIPSEETRKTLATFGLTISSYAHDIQTCLADDPEKLREKLVVQMEATKEAATRFKELKAPDEFVYNQIKRKHDIYIFALYKLKYQALFFAKTNKELSAEIQASFVELQEVIRTLKLSDKIVEVELRHAMYHFSTVLERSVYKFENWVEVNSNRTDDIVKVEEVSTTFSQLYDTLIRSANREHRAALLKLKFIFVLESATKSIVKLAELEESGSLGGQEFLRSSLFDFVAFGKAYGHNLKAVIE